MTSDPSPFRCTEAEKAAALPPQPSKPQATTILAPEAADLGRPSALLADADAEGVVNQETTGPMDWRQVRLQNLPVVVNAGLRDYFSFPPFGRVKRLTFVTAILGLNSIYLWLIFLILTSGYRSSNVMVMVIFCLGIVLFVVDIRLASQRCRDIGWTPLLVLLILIPYVNAIFLLCLFFWPSEIEEGAPIGSWGIFAVSFVLCLFLILLVLGLTILGAALTAGGIP